MVRFRAFFLCFPCCAVLASAQSINVENFNNPGATGAVIPGSSWVNNVTRGPDAITVAGTALDVNGWGASGQSLNATGMAFVTIFAQQDVGNVAPSLVLQFEDAQLRTHTLSVSTALFALGTLTAVQLPLGPLPAGFNLAQITGWTIGGGTNGIVAFRMTLDHLTLSATAAPVARLPHSADTNRDFRMSIAELSRLIQLYATRQDTTRTGAYAVATTATEDGFTQDLARAAGGVVTLARYHSADTNNDGIISLVELTRGIELYNYRVGTERTGQYHIQADTEDGFALGP